MIVMRLDYIVSAKKKKYKWQPPRHSDLFNFPLTISARMGVIHLKDVESHDDEDVLK